MIERMRMWFQRVLRQGDITGLQVFVGLTKGWYPLLIWRCKVITDRKQRALYVVARKYPCHLQGFRTRR